MRSVVERCLALGIAIGAHPSYPDRAGFGRVKLNLPLSQLEISLKEQLSALVAVATNLGAKVHHVKPHGALYNEATTDGDLAMCIARAVQSVDKSLILLGLAGSPMLEVWKAAGIEVRGEAFADRSYEADGSLRHRRYPDALITDPARAAGQAVGIACEGTVVAVNGARLRVDAQTICIHGDTDNALAIAMEVRTRLVRAGVEIAAL